jgi:glutaredoxin
MVLPSSLFEILPRVSPDFCLYTIRQSLVQQSWKPFPKLLNSLGMADTGEVVVYSRKGCHLCEIVKESLVKLHKRGGFNWREIDVDSDAEIRRRYTDEVPVVFINGRKAFKYRMDEQEFLRKLSA